MLLITGQALNKAEAEDGVPAVGDMTANSADGERPSVSLDPKIPDAIGTTAFLQPSDLSLAKRCTTGCEM